MPAQHNYTITGPLEQRVFNSLGITLFLFGITALPEIQDVLADDPTTGNTFRPVIKAITAVHFVFVPLYVLVGCIGECSTQSHVHLLVCISVCVLLGFRAFSAGALPRPVWVTHHRRQHEAMTRHPVKAQYSLN